MTSLYIFGSCVRGEFDEFSDVDLLLINSSDNNSYDLNKFSVYSPERIKQLYEEGNPFAWHLYYESKLIYSNSDKDFLLEIGIPNEYKNMATDLIKFEELFRKAESSLMDKKSLIFDLGTMFLAIRNFATCFSLGYLKQKNFSRNACLNLDTFSLKISNESYELMKKCRIHSTRGIGNIVTLQELDKLVSEIPKVKDWFHQINSIINV